MTKPPSAGTDREQKINHPDNASITSQHEYAAPAGLFKNKAQPVKLLLLVGPKIALFSKEFSQEIG